MNEGVLIAIVSGVLTLTGTIITVFAGLSKSSKNIEIVQAVTNEKIEHLTEEVKKHNDFGNRIPVIETKIENLDRRVGELERNDNG